MIKKQIVVKWMFLLFVVFQHHPLFSQAKKTSPQQIVHELLDCNTAFPDNQFSAINWEEFAILEEANQKFNSENPDYGLLNACVVYYTNLYRTSKGKQPLRFVPELRDAAAFHSHEMMNRKFFDHYHPGNSKYRRPLDRATRFGYKGGSVGENIAILYHSKEPTYLELGEEIVQTWIDSKPHRKNLLDFGYHSIGHGFAVHKKVQRGGSLVTVWATQVFGG